MWLQTQRSNSYFFKTASPRLRNAKTELRSLHFFFYYLECDFYYIKVMLLLELTLLFWTLPVLIWKRSPFRPCSLVCGWWTLKQILQKTILLMLCFSNIPQIFYVFVITLCYIYFLSNVSTKLLSILYFWINQ